MRKSDKSLGLSNGKSEIMLRNGIVCHDRSNDGYFGPSSLSWLRCLILAIFAASSLLSLKIVLFCELPPFPCAKKNGKIVTKCAKVTLIHVETFHNYNGHNFLRVNLREDQITLRVCTIQFSYCFQHENSSSARLALASRFPPASCIPWDYAY